MKGKIEVSSVEKKKKKTGKVVYVCVQVCISVRSYKIRGEIIRHRTDYGKV